MANPPHQPNPNARIIKRVIKKTGKKYQRQNSLVSWLAIAFLLGTGSLVVGFAWISFLYIFNPQKVSWLNKVLPTWARISMQGENPLSLKQIQTAITKQGLIPGETLTLKNKGFLLPVYKKRANCQDDCQEIIELRLYQQGIDGDSQVTRKYQLISQTTVTGPEESFVAAPLSNAINESPGTSVALPLTEIGQMEAAPSPGMWFYLRGQRQDSAYTAAYGHIIYYNPERDRIQQMLSWTSPTGQLPQWQKQGLVINQTVGLEPQLLVYQVKSVKLFLNPVELVEITLKPAAWKNDNYEKALSLARSGLWTPAYTWLQSIQKQNKNIPVSAQAQIEVIRLHSQLTQAQAAKSWASPSQEILANLIDGRWSQALEVFKQGSPEKAQEIAAFLKTDDGRLWNRLEAALEVNQNRPEVQLWGGLIVAAREGNAKATSWLQKRKATSQTLSDSKVLFAKLRGEVVTKSPVIPNHPSRIIGSVQAITKVNPSEWLQPEEKLDVVTHQKWYQVEVAGFHDGKRWLYPPFNNLNLPKTSADKYLWSNLGINSDPLLQIAIWLPNGEQKATTATIKAVKLAGGSLRLLALPTENIIEANRALAVSNSALEWVEPLPISVSELAQQNLQQLKVILPKLWKSLQASGQIPKSDVPSLPQIQQKVGNWLVQRLDLTGNSKAETVFTISPEALATLNPGAKKPKGKESPRTVIFSDGGSIIYTDFAEKPQQNLSAIAKLAEVDSLALLVVNGKGYSLKRWSGKNQRFE
ncbi:hypothetical protein [Calothrix sp. PCC 6303]|uniref:hypothetical protein n=1 Tax=Calothrix sp. PCC 6303 TaxID=1170562 RepID=UPI0002A04CC6|nr:hypothetical protein [Calothrix sp. PCC 6303]AFZ02294.1 hypothetical protein Cal6303_3356 [Calothrix sp. PCC 6303]